MSRTLRILGRFPAHLGATRAGTQLFTVVDALAAQIDVFSADLAAVRRSHRIGHADALIDVLKLGALHGIGPDDLGIAELRRAVALKLVAALEAAGAPDARNAAAEALFDLWGIDQPTPRLSLFAPAHAPADPPDLAAAATRLAAKLRGELRARRQTDAVRARIVRIAELHAAGNASVPTLLDAAANALDQDLDRAANAAVKAQLVTLGRAATLELAVGDDLFHSKDLFWHSSFVRDRAPLVRVVSALAPAKLVRMNERIAASELADQMLLRFDQLAPTLQELGLTQVAGATLLDQDTATLVAAKLGFTVERFARAVAPIGAHTSVAQLAVLLGQSTSALLAHLAELGVTGLTPGSEVTPDDAARAARRYGFVVQQTLPVVQELIGIEENPLQPKATDPPEQCGHGHLWSVIRKGFGREPLETRIHGVANHTFGPMIVNRDEGRGVGWFGAVGADQTLVFESDGRALLDGDDVTDRAFSWLGACFADAAVPSTRDFGFAGPGDDPLRRSTFVVATPAGALDRDFAFPHAGENVEMPGIGIGETRFAFFVQQAHLGSRAGDGSVRAVTPHPFIAFADRSLFAAVPASSRPVGDTHPDSDYVPAHAADLVLAWQEHEAYALRVIVPKRFKLLDGPAPAGSAGAGPGAAPTLAQRVALALERFRPAGVQVRVDYVDDSWILGEGSLTDPQGGPIDPNLILRGGTVLSPAPTGGT